MFAVIMAGGSGTRFWPESRRKKPKQLIKLFGDKTMIQYTVSRISPLIPGENVFVVTNAVQAEALGRQLPLVPPGNILVEPLGRNTAPCIGLAALYLRKRDPDAIMAVLPADHMIRKEAGFLKILEAAREFIRKEKDALITLGIPPSSPHTGYGYIKSGEKVSGHNCFRVDKFTEKPDRETAKKFLDDGGYYWNSGTFIWKASSILDMIRLYLPDLYENLAAFERDIGSEREKESLEKLYRNVSPISVDFGIMEKSDKTFMIEADIGWSDIGSWSAMEEIYSKDQSGNILQGKHITVDSRGCMVFSPQKTVALVGVEDLVVVETEDAILVCKKDRAEDVKKVTQKLGEEGMDELL